jgi:RecB family exonuclease
MSAPRPVEDVSRSLSLASLVAELRQAVGDPTCPEPERVGAASQLARLTEAGVRGAAPATWWGLPALSDDRPVRPEGEPVHVSPSKVESFSRCQLRWFLEHVGGTATTTTQQSVGTLVHAVAETAVDADTSTEEALLARLHELLPTADLGHGWVAGKERAKAERMVRRLAAWLAANGRDVVATELAFTAELEGAVIAGRVDRIERDEQGRAVVVDLKTGSSKVPDADLSRHAQLAAYQVAVTAGAFADQGLVESGGAELVQVGKGAFSEKPRVQAQSAVGETDDPGWAEQLVLGVAEGMAGSAFHAVVNQYCPMCPVRTSCPLQEDGRLVVS